MLHQGSSHPLVVFWVFFDPGLFFLKKKIQTIVVTNGIEKLGVPARRMGVGFVGWVNPWQVQSLIRADGWWWQQPQGRREHRRACGASLVTRYSLLLSQTVGEALQ